MKKPFKNSSLITKNSEYNFDDHKPSFKTERLALESKSLVLETNKLKLALGNLFESIIVFYLKLNSQEETFEQVAILEANYPYQLSKKTNLEKLYDSEIYKIKGGIRCDIFRYSENLKQAQIFEVKWGKSKTTIQSGFDTYPDPLLERFQSRHGFEDVKQYTIGIMPFERQDFKTHYKQEYACFPVEICNELSKNQEQLEILTYMVKFLLNPNNKLQKDHWTEFQTVINLLANQSQINDHQTALSLAIETNQKIQHLIKGKTLEGSKTGFQNNISQKINCSLLSFLCKLSRIEDEKTIPGSNLEILQEVEFLTEIFNNLTEYTKKDLPNQDLSQIYQILFIAIKQFKINFESLYFENTEFVEDYYTQEEEKEFADLINFHKEYAEIISKSLELQKSILQQKIIELNFKYTNYYKLNFLKVLQTKISVVEAEIDKRYKYSSNS